MPTMAIKRSVEPVTVAISSVTVAAPVKHINAINTSTAIHTNNNTSNNNGSAVKAVSVAVVEAASGGDVGNVAKRIRLEESNTKSGAQT
jgi:hypothetical protein